MAEQNAPPSANPADQDNLGGVFNTVLRKFLQGVDDCLPARVVSYDRDTNIATVQPLVSMLTTDNRQVARATVSQVPVFRFGGGGFSLSYPLQANDLGWIKANDRDVSMVMQTFAAGAPNTRRMHSFEDAWFIPDRLRSIVIAGEDADCAVLQSDDGVLKLSIGAGRVKMQAGASSVTVTAAGVAILGVLTINGTPYLAHTHAGVQPGAGNTGGVNP